MKKTLEIEIEIPLTPNYIRYGERKTIPIENFTEEELRQIGKEWIENLVKAAAAKRKRK